ncbi:biotin/lipoyl-binding protein [Lactiplantibacillus garii]|uniref:Biotin carboxyl carrier protein of acetyl-CoA carboxylase n=1 Tax=Lactiplantibacillus garii TaxID=2306423 RepID=A0A3R8L2N5_9LACO|nr:acetyl-CoA carboxylase biotin carboxyl carrier protein subunit [Lactiplantibacillus garii]RRK11242.1 biotin/lipoyl-binding protein [Lactiplantibacillus garii]
MELDKIYQLMDKFEQSNLTNFEYRDQEFEIQMGKKGHGKPVVSTQPTPLPAQPAESQAPVAPTPVSTPVAPAAEPAPTVASTPEATRAPQPAPIDPKECVTAPVVGIYYQAHSSEEAPYVKLGDHVSVGQQVGLIQAMQMMRPVVAKQSGQVKALLVKNGDEVNFGQPLIQLIPDTPDDI